MEISSPAFASQQPIPTQHTCDGANISPALVFEHIPTSAQSLALIMHDPDATIGDFTHWTVWNIPATASPIAEGKLPSGAVEGLTDFGRTGYGGPCPPSGRHRYFFELYALNIALLPLTNAATRLELETAMNGHILEKATLVGTYQRQ